LVLTKGLMARRVGVTRVTFDGQWQDVCRPAGRYLFFQKPIANSWVI